MTPVEMVAGSPSPWSAIPAFQTYSSRRASLNICSITVLAGLAMLAQTRLCSGRGLTTGPPSVPGVGPQFRHDVLRLADEGSDGEHGGHLGHALAVALLAAAEPFLQLVRPLRRRLARRLSQKVFNSGGGRQTILVEIVRHVVGQIWEVQRLATPALDPRSNRLRRGV